MDRLGILGPLLQVDGNHGRDDLAGLLHGDEVAHADVLAGDLLKVVEGGPGDGGAAQLHRIELRHRRDHPGAPDLEGDGMEAGLGLLRRIFVGDRPAGGLVGGTQHLLLIEAADLDHRAVGRKRESGAVLVELPDGSEDPFGSVDVPEPGVAGQTPLADLTVQLDLGIGFGADHLPQTVENHGQRTPGHFPRIQQFQGAGGGVAGVGENGFAGLFPGPVEGGERRLGKIGLPAELDDLGQAFHRKGQVADGFQIFGDVVALFAVPASETLDQAAVFVADADGHPVDLGLDGKLGGLAVQIFGDAIEELTQLLFAVGVVEALHRDGVTDRPERVERGAAHLFGGRIFVDQLRMSFFEVLQFAIEAVIGGIGNLRTRLHVIEPVVTANLLQEFGVALGGRGAHGRNRRRSAKPRETPRMSTSQSARETSRPGARR